jgi:hypothetical protein
MIRGEDLALKIRAKSIEVHRAELYPTYNESGGRMRSNDNTTATSLLYFAAGLSLGAAVGILLAPASGADTRRYLGSHAGAAREYLDYGRDLYDKGRELADEAAHMYEEGRDLIER